ncbi:Glutaredoxin [Cynara cardunculus var. scolymus]|uniref:Glutaredoxin n=1 Tax=Cynara cardunculus var. scolymus TaxID=59895 RepID=A0A118JTV5_CYNCS|nr:Glutaredoxin [Cynara cardunculus var. scolymus]
MRGRFLGKPKTISAITTVKQGLVFQASTLSQYFPTPTVTSDIKDEDYCRAPVSLEDLEKSVLVLEKIGNHSSLLEFEEKCPPGGSDSVILYTTSLRGIRKTFEDCNAIRFLLESFRVLYDERDVSMHLEFREEFWRTLGGRVIPPRLFIRGRHIGGVDEVVWLHEQGKLKNLVNGIPRSPTRGPCKGCGGMRFVLCFSCNGSRKVMLEEVNNSDDSPFPVVDVS